MSIFINTDMNPDWEDQEVHPSGNNATTGSGDQTGFFEKLNREIRFDWMEAAKARPLKEARPLAAGEHIKVKARPSAPTGHEEFLALCKKMGLDPKNTPTGKHQVKRNSKEKKNNKRKK